MPTWITLLIVLKTVVFLVEGETKPLNIDAAFPKPLFMSVLQIPLF